MTDLRQAAQQALEALIDAANVLSAPMFADAVTALKAALEQQQAEPIPTHRITSWGHCGVCRHDRIPGEGCARQECPDAPQQQAETVAVERWLWIFEEKNGDRYTHKNLFYTADEAAESARICGVKAVKKIDSSKVTQQAEPVGMRMPKVGDKVICLEDESLGTVESLTAGGSPDIVFDDGSRGTYMLSEFAELFGYVTAPPKRPWVGLTDEEVQAIWKDVIGWGDPSHDDEDLVRAIEAKLKERNT